MMTRDDVSAQALPLPLKRRDMLIGAGALLATGVALAADGDQKESAHKHADHAPSHGGALAAANACSEQADLCIAHCMVVFAEGDTSLADCAAIVLQTGSLCRAMAYQLASNSPYVESLAGVCRQACSDCEEECRKHLKHQECKDCADACAALVDELDQLKV